MYINFAVSDWDNFPAQHTAQGWTESKRVLLFQFHNSPEQLVLRLYIGPGPESVRQALVQAAQDHPKVFRSMSKRVTSKWSQIYRKQLLNRQDYEDADPEALAEKVHTQWNRFLTQDLPAIREAIAEMDWPELPQDTEA